MHAASASHELRQAAAVEPVVVPNSLRPGQDTSMPNEYGQSTFSYKSTPVVVSDAAIDDVQEFDIRQVLPPYSPSHSKEMQAEFASHEVRQLAREEPLVAPNSLRPLHPSSAKKLYVIGGGAGGEGDGGGGDGDGGGGW